MEQLVDTSLLYVTCEGPEEARRIGRAVVEARLAACVNILPAVRSIYRWQGEVCDDEEALLVVKTCQDQLPALQRAVAQLHSYDVPELLALPVHAGSPEYLRWLRDQVGQGRAGAAE